jgi:endonuclease/exonuclease/phosphatase (EEP) superfamily protein YafD
MQTVLTAAVNLVLAGLFLVAFGALFGRLHPVIDLFGQFLLPAIVGAAALTLVVVLIGRYQAAAFAVAALAANLALAWPWLQAPDATPANGPRFKLLVFNVFYHNPRVDLAAELARETNADVVVLLEMIPRIRSHLDAIAATYPYRLECWQGHLCDALILSRFPLTDISAALPPPQTRRFLASVSVDVNGRPLSLFAAHLTLPFPFRSFADQPAEADDVAGAVASVSGPRVLVGDFNAATWGAAMAKQRERAGLTALTGLGGSWPTFLPKHAGIPIDHVLASPELVLMSRELRTVYGSDHRAVLTEIAFKN